MSAGYRRVEWVDSVGRRWVTQIPDDAPDGYAQSGLPVGPISLESLGLPLEWEVRLHNELVGRDMLTLADVEMPGGREKLAGAVRALVKFGAHELAMLYADQMSAKH